MNYQKLILVGNVTGDAQKRKSSKGDVAYTTFSVGVSDGKEKTNFFPVVAFSKLAIMAAKYIKKGRQVLVEGRVETGDKGRFNVVADRIVLGRPTGKPAEKAMKTE